MHLLCRLSAVATAASPVAQIFGAAASRRMGLGGTTVPAWVRTALQGACRRGHSARLWAPVRVTRSRPSPEQTILLGRAVGVGGGLGLLLMGLRAAPLLHCQSQRVPEENNRLSGLTSSAEVIAPTFPWRQFLHLLWPHLWWLMSAVVSALAVAVLNIQLPQMLGQIVNVVSTGLTSASSMSSTEAGSEAGSAAADFLRAIKEPCLKMLQLYAAQAAMTFAYIYSLSCVGERVANQMRQDLFASIVRQDVAFFDGHKSGEIVSRLTTDVQDFKSSFKQCVSQGLRSFTQTLGCAVALYWISPQMTGLMMVVVPTVIVTGTCLGSVLRRWSRQAQTQVAKATAVGDECISNIRTVRAFAMEDKEMDLYADQLDKSRVENERLGLGIGLFQAGTNLFLNGIVLSTLYYGGYLLTTDQLSPGDLMSFLVATQTIQRSLTQMSLLFGQLIKGLSAGARVFEYINLDPSIPIEGGQRIPFHCLLGDIEFRDVRFHYPTRPDQTVLDNFSLRIPAGQMVALVGASGGGKSTVAALLERFYDCQEGSVLLDGVPIQNLDPKWLRGKAVGYINQEPVLFATSVIENIRYGRPDATDQEVYEAAKSANAHDFISAFPDGYATVLGERGVTVSGGQKQRIAIARALLKNPSILILDEATSALDTESEKIVQDALDTAVKGRTVLVIAHRLSTIQNANVIAVLSRGRVVEMGTHQTLKKAGGMYSDLIRQQQKDEQETKRNEPSQRG